MMTYIVTTTVIVLLSVLALAIVGYYAYRFGHDQGHSKGYDAGNLDGIAKGYQDGYNNGYREAEDKYKHPELTPEQIEAKNQRERFDEHVNRLLAFRVPSKKVSKRS